MRAKRCAIRTIVIEKSKLKYAKIIKADECEEKQLIALNTKKGIYVANIVIRITNYDIIAKDKKAINGFMERIGNIAKRIKTKSKIKIAERKINPFKLIPSAAKLLKNGDAN